METSTKIALGSTAVGLAAGAGTGLKIGSSKAAKIIENAKVVTSNVSKYGEPKEYVQLNKDAFIAAKVNKQLHNITRAKHIKNEQGQFVNKAKIVLGNIRKNAAERFESCCTVPKKACELADKTKIKWLKGMAAAGLALGALVGLAIKNSTSHTTINDGNTIIKISSEKTTQAKKKEAKEKKEAKAQARAEKQAQKEAQKAAKAEAKALKALHKQQEAEAVCEALKSV